MVVSDNYTAESKSEKVAQIEKSALAYVPRKKPDVPSPHAGNQDERYKNRKTRDLGSVVARVRMMQRARVRLIELAELQDDWDDDGALAVRDGDIELARQLLPHLVPGLVASSAFRDSQLRLAPYADGGIDLSIQNEVTSLLVHVSSEPVSITYSLRSSDPDLQVAGEAKESALVSRLIVCAIRALK